ncbi:MAG: LAGLIDADG family homing endonuclease [Patescibacteria group bacterium]
MAKTHSQYVCQQCGYSQVGWAGKCPNCGTWGSLVETFFAEEKQETEKRKEAAKPISLSAIPTKKTARISTKISELDRVLGGGLVPGQVVLLAGEPGIGKCVAAETLIPTERGLVPIANLKPQNARKGFVGLRIAVQSLNGPQKTSHFYTSNKQPTKRITTRMGYELQATYTHPLLILSPEGKKSWKKMKQIKVGDYVAIQRHGAVWGNKTSLPPFKFKVRTNAVAPIYPQKIDEDMAYCLGLLVGDGGLTDFGHINLTTADPEIKKNFENWISRLGLKISSTIKYRLQVNNRLFHRWLRHIGLSLTRAESKSIPELILSAPKPIVKAFLQGLFDTDGSSNSKPNGRLPGVIEYCTTSKQLAKQVHLVLLQFGIVAKLRFRKNQKRGAWVIQLLGDSARLFYSDICFRLSRKQNNMRLLSKFSNSNLDVIPYLPFVDSSRIPNDNRWDRRYLRGARSATYKKLGLISRFIPEFKGLLEPRFYWDRVESVVAVGESVCFDLCVPKTHSLVTNGIVSHNSTLLLELADKIGNTLYVSGEESVGQIKVRADRLKVKSKTLKLLEETDTDKVVGAIDNPSLIVVDSIQTMATEDLSGFAGSVGQVRESAFRLLKKAKEINTPLFLVGHVTKEGTVAGPAVLAHIVDTLLWFEGDKSLTLRVLRAVKNRFGPTDEVGIFEMEDRGLIPVSNSEKIFLTKAKKEVPGSVVTSILQGTRPILVEIQSLVVPTKMAFPRRVAQGIDLRRLELLLAVLIRRCGLPIHEYDVFVNVAGGIKVTEPGADLAISLSIASSFFEKPIPKNLFCLGEVGLLGEVREVVAEEKRVKEARRLGFSQALTQKEIKYLGEAVKKLLR